MSRLATLLVLIAASLAAVGCTSGNGSSADLSGEEQKVADVIDSLAETAQKGDERRICRQILSTELVSKLERGAGGDCNKVVNEALKNVDAFRLSVEDVKLSGDTATARVQTGGDGEDERNVELVREGDTWKIAELPAPPADA